MAKIVIDAGHGGDDPGASANGIIEKDLTLKISKYMYDRFKQLGIPVALTRSSDETLDPTTRVQRILAPYGNSSDVIVISNHINAGGGDGAEVVYALRNNGKLANLVLDSIKDTGQNVRKAYQRRLPSDTSKDYYFIHRNTGITEPIIVEYGFLDSKQDDVVQLKNDYEKYAEAVVKAVSDYLNISYDQQLSGYYIVKSGDSLWSIAKKYNTTVDELKKLNNLTSNLLSVGQKIKVPTDEVEINPSLNNIYVVKSGDSLYSIANKYGTTVDILKSLNGLTTNLLNVGQELKLPSKINIDIEQKPTENYILYTVKKGDNLYSIARDYNTTVNNIMNYNNLNTNLLSIGQIVKIPTDTSIITYTVKKGDSLYSIAKNYNTTVDSIKSKNNLTSNILNIGQVLKI